MIYIILTIVHIQKSVKRILVIICAETVFIVDGTLASVCIPCHSSSYKKTTFMFFSQETLAFSYLILFSFQQSNQDYYLQFMSSIF